MNLKQIREKANLTQEQASKITGFTIRYISLLENGERNPSDKAKNILAKAYRVPVVEIFLASQRTKRSKERREDNEHRE
jgi:transcriptional regulator with XRE-family HTH domain